jgi:hypothetical protein
MFGSAQPVSIKQADALRSRLIRRTASLHNANKYCKPLNLYVYFQKYQKCAKQCVITAGAENVLYLLDD